MAQNGKMKVTKTKLLQIIFILLLFGMGVRFFLYACLAFPFIEKSDKPQKATYKTHHVVIIGEAQDKSFLESVLKGAKEVSYDCIVELLVPRGYAATENLDSLFEYASFIEPDGIIACLPENFYPKVSLENSKGKKIPLITLNTYNAELEQVAHICTNQSELGRKIALEGAAYLSKGGVAEGRVAVVRLTPDFSANYSTLMSSLTNTLLRYKNIDTQVLDFALQSDKQNSSDVIRQLLIKEAIDLIICPSAEDTIKVSQIITELHKDGRVGIIGFGSGEILETYLTKGTITELLSIDSESMGRSAINELFSYIDTGYANSYVMSGVQTRRSENR